MFIYNGLMISQVPSFGNLMRSECSYRSQLLRSVHNKSMSSKEEPQNLLFHCQLSKKESNYIIGKTFKPDKNMMGC